LGKLKAYDGKIGRNSLADRDLLVLADEFAVPIAWVAHEGDQVLGTIALRSSQNKICTNFSKSPAAMKSPPKLISANSSNNGF
jgi:hypothetical protein